MSRIIWVGAVAYDPKVVTIWEGMRRYFHEEARLPVEVVLFQSYEMQVAALLAAPNDPPRELTSLGIRTSLIYKPIPGASTAAARLPCATPISAGIPKSWRPPGAQSRRSPISEVALWRSGSRDSGHAAILPVYFLEREGLVEGQDYRTLRFNSDLGKHGDTGASEVEVVRAVLDGRADAGAIGSPFWKTVRTERLVPEGALTEIWTSPPYNHCMFTARPDLDESLEERFVEALSAMSYDNPSHRAVLDAEGLRRWESPHLHGYDSLRQASAQQGFFSRPI